MRGGEKMNIKKILVGSAVGGLLFGVFAISAFAVSLVSNGSFENGTDPGSFTTLIPGDLNITGWTINSGTVDYIGTYWQASDGVRSIDMSGNGPGSISQSFSTVLGHTYTVTFDMAGNPDGSPNIKTMNADVGGGPIPFTFDTTGHDKTNMGWTPNTFNFTATGASTTLTFTSTTDTPFGPALDNVTVNEVATPTPTLTPTPTVVQLPTNKDQCKKGGWQSFGVFKNQGDCVSFVATGGKNPPANP